MLRRQMKGNAPERLRRAMMAAILCIKQRYDLSLPPIVRHHCHYDSLNALLPLGDTYMLAVLWDHGHFVVVDNVGTHVVDSNVS